MSKTALIITALVIGLLFLGGLGYLGFNHLSPTQSVAPEPEDLFPSFPKMTVKSFLIALGDNGKQGQLIGCDDSLVPIMRQIEPTKDQIGGAITELLSLEDQNYGPNQLYNALHQSDLKLDKAVQTNRHADVYLTGSISMGGVCDEPRIKEQLEATALQFPIVDDITIFINGQPMDEVISSKGN